MTRWRSLVAPLALSLSALAILPATAGAVVVSASLGQVTATLTYELTPNPEYPSEKKLSAAQLAIARAGQVAYSREVASSLPYCAHEYPGECWPQGARIESPEFAAQYPSLQVLELASNGEPAVVLHLYSGGAHCCFVDQVFSWNSATSAYEVAERFWGSLTPRLSDLGHNGQFELVTGDNRFEYQFASFAFSGFPVQVFVVRDGMFVEVTRSYPSQVAAGARSQYRRYEHWRRQGFGLGFLAAWVADEYLLSKRQHALQTLLRENRLHHLLEVRSFGERPTNVGSAYIAKLKRFLRKIGYG
jgi:hypothetical protein